MMVKDPTRLIMKKKNGDAPKRRRVLGHRGGGPKLLSGWIKTAFMATLVMTITVKLLYHSHGTLSLVEFFWNEEPMVNAVEEEIQELYVSERTNPTTTTNNVLASLQEENRTRPLPKVMDQPMDDALFEQKTTVENEVSTQPAAPAVHDELPVDYPQFKILLLPNQPTATRGPYNSNVKWRPFRMLIAIFLTESEDDQRKRKVIQSTFGAFNKDMVDLNVTTLPHVCSLHEYWQSKSNKKRRGMEECQLLYTFVVGAAQQSSDPNAGTEYDDDDLKQGRPMALSAHNNIHNITHPNTYTTYIPEITYLNIVENMNDGKSITWFKYAATALPEDLEIDLIAKADSDCLIYPTELAFEIDTSRRELNLSYGPGPMQNVFGGSREIGDRVMNSQFMQGGFYFMSRDVAQYIVSDQCHRWDYINVTQRVEDVEMAKFVRSSPRHVNELVIPRYSAYFHHPALKQDENYIDAWKWYLATLVAKDRIVKEQRKKDNNGTFCPNRTPPFWENEKDLLSRNGNDHPKLLQQQHYEAAIQRLMQQCRTLDRLNDYQVCRPTTLDALYACEGKRYEVFAIKLEALVRDVTNNKKKSAFWGKRRHSPFPANTTILAVGNADTRQLLRTLTCQYADDDDFTNLLQRVDMEALKSYDPVRRGSYYFVEFANHATLHLVTNSALFFHHDWPRYLEDLVQKPLRDFDAVIFGKLDKFSQAYYNNAFLEISITTTNITTATTPFHQHSSAAVNIAPPPTLVEFANHFAGPIVVHSALVNDGNSAMFLEMNTLLKVVNDENPNRTNIQLLNGRQYIPKLGDCNSHNRWNRVGECEKKHSPHQQAPCLGIGGGHPDLIVWDIVEALNDIFVWSIRGIVRIPHAR